MLKKWVNINWTQTFDCMFSVFYNILQRNFAISLNFMMLFVDVAMTS